MNKKKKRSALIAGLCATVVLGMASAAFIGCNNSENNDEGKGNLNFEVNAEITIGYYEYCTVPVIVATDDSGNTYFPKTEVKNSAGQSIALEDGKFFVTQETDYTFVYTLTWNGETVVKQTTAKVADLTEPSITPVSSELSAFTDREVEIPAIDLDDNKDTEEQLSVSVKVTCGDNEVRLPTISLHLRRRAYTISYTP